MSTRNGVHNRIHTLRGEQFRHLQNLRGSRSHLTSTNIHGVPSLPFRLLSLVDPSFKLIGVDDSASPPSQQKSTINTNATDSQFDGMSLRPPAGPTPPKSWMLNTKKDIRGSTSWRAEVLSLVFNHLSTNAQTPSPPCGRNCAAATPRIPSLSLLCLQQFLAICTTSEFCDEVVPGIPPHLRKDLIRFSAVHSPLNSVRLNALWEETGHVDGEIIVVGPYATLKDDHFNRSINDHSSSTGVPINEGDEKTISKSTNINWDWDTEDTESVVPLSTLILLNTTLSSSILFDLPPTLTHVAFINISTPIPLHRLPKLCPLLTLLDLSYNTWLGTTFIDAFDAEGHGITGILGDPQPPTDPTTKAIVDLARVDWLKWNHLKVLGFRGNYVPEDLVTRVNQKRWDDVEITL